VFLLTAPVDCPVLAAAFCGAAAERRTRQTAAGRVSSGGLFCFIISNLLLILEMS
jgi:hypothetical protein